MALKHNRGLAWLLCGMMIVVAIFGLGGYRLARQYQQTSEAFYLGVNGDGFSIDRDLQTRADSAYNLYTVASRYLEANDPTLTALLAAREQLLGSESISDKYLANQALENAAMAVYDLLGTYPLSESDAAYREGLISEMRSANATISHDGYNQLATDFNQQRAAIPARWIAALWGLDALQYFR